jgi:hypothetical protein
MAVIGSFGSIVFSVSGNKINTFKNAKWDSTTRYSQHARHLKDPLVEFTGDNNDTFSFTMEFEVWLGVNPIDEVAKAIVMKRNAEVHRLVIGNKAYGKNKWVLTSVSAPLKEFDNKGNILVASIDVSLLAYPVR